MVKNMLSDFQKEIILAFAKADMQISATSRNTYRHRNTIIYQIGVIKERTGLDPRNFFDLVTLVQLANETEKTGETA